MNRDAVVAVLQKEQDQGQDQGIENKGNDTWSAPLSLEMTLFIASRGETMTVSKVTVLELAEAFIVATDNRNRRAYFGYEEVVGLRFGSGDQAKGRNAGF